MPDWTPASRTMKDVFELPEYFGNNLNALSEGPVLSRCQLPECDPGLMSWKW